MGTVMVSPERLRAAPSGFSIRLVSVAAVAPGGMWSLTSVGVPAHSYEQYEDLLASGSVDAVYVVSPNAIHRDQVAAARETTREVRAGV